MAEKYIVMLKDDVYIIIMNCIVIINLMVDGKIVNNYFIKKLKIYLNIIVYICI